MMNTAYPAGAPPPPLKQTGRASTPIFIAVVDQMHKIPPNRISLPLGTTIVGRDNGIDTDDLQMPQQLLQFDFNGETITVRGIYDQSVALLIKRGGNVAYRGSNPVTLLPNLPPEIVEVGDLITLRQGRFMLTVLAKPPPQKVSNKKPKKNKYRRNSSRRLHDATAIGFAGHAVPPALATAPAHEPVPEAHSHAYEMSVGEAAQEAPTYSTLPVPSDGYESPDSPPALYPPPYYHAPHYPAPYYAYHHAHYSPYAAFPAYAHPYAHAYGHHYAHHYSPYHAPQQTYYTPYYNYGYPWAGASAYAMNVGDLDKKQKKKFKKKELKKLLKKAAKKGAKKHAKEFGAQEPLTREQQLQAIRATASAHNVFHSRPHAHPHARPHAHAHPHQHQHAHAHPHAPPAQHRQPYEMAIAQYDTSSTDADSSSTTSEASSPVHFHRNHHHDAPAVHWHAPPFSSWRIYDNYNHDCHDVPFSPVEPLSQPIPFDPVEPSSQSKTEPSAPAADDAKKVDEEQVVAVQAEVRGFLARKELEEKVESKEKTQAADPGPFPGATTDTAAAPVAAVTAPVAASVTAPVDSPSAAPSAAPATTPACSAAVVVAPVTDVTTAPVTAAVTAPAPVAAAPVTAAAPASLAASTTASAPSTTGPKFFL